MQGYIPQKRKKSVYAKKCGELLLFYSEPVKRVHLYRCPREKPLHQVKTINRMSSLKIGIVEDDLFAVGSVTDLLQEFNYVMLSTPRYSEASAIVEIQVPDLLLISLPSPKGVDSIDTARALQQTFNVPFIVLTANAVREALELAPDLIPAAVLTWPVNHAQLYASIEMAVAYNQAFSRSRIAAHTADCPRILD